MRLIIRIKIYRSISEIDESRWDAIVGKDRILCSYKYIEIMEKAGINKDRCYYPVVYDGDQIVAHTSVYLMTAGLDLFAQGLLKKIIHFIRRGLKSFFILRYFECGPPAEVGSLVSLKDGADKVKIMRVLCDGIEGLGKKLGVKFFVFRDFYDEEKEFHDIFTRYGYTKTHNLPKAELKITWKSFNNYLNSMRSNYRCKIVKSMKKCADANVSIQVLREFSSYSHELKELYDNVSSRAKEIKREPFAEAFFQNINNYLKDKSILLLAVKDSKPIGFALLLVNDKTFLVTLIGLDYAQHQQSYTYFNLFYKTIELAIENGMDKIDMGITTLDPKRDMGSGILALNMYMKHSNPILNKIIPLLFDTITPPDTTAPRNVFKEAVDIEKK